MKTTLLGTVLFTTLAALPVKAADLACKADNGQDRLELREVVNQRLDADVLLVQGGKDILFGAHLQHPVESSPLFSKKTYRLTGGGTHATLNVVTRQLMGRGGPGPKIITATFIPRCGKEVVFRCHETAF